MSMLSTDNLPLKPTNKANETRLKDKILEKIDELPPLPRVVTKVVELISDPNSDSKKIAEVIETDQAIATKVLKVANSAYYRMSGKISSIQHASIVLGNQRMGEVVTVAGSEDTLDGLILEQKGEIGSFMEKEEKTFLDAESHFFVFNHAEIVFEVCKKWNFPESMNAAIKGHHHPSNSDNTDLTYILHMADYIARLSGIGYDNDDFLYDIEKGTMDYLSLKQEDLSDIVLKISESVQKISS